MNRIITDTDRLNWLDENYSEYGVPGILKIQTGSFRERVDHLIHLEDISLANPVEALTTTSKNTHSRLTDDPTDPRLTRGGDTEPTPQAEVYLVLSEAERAKGFIRPYRDAYRHTECGEVTTMGRVLSETYARDPYFYGYTYCVKCSKHRPVSEFNWTLDNEVVGS